MQAICAEVARLLDVRTALLLPSPAGPLLRAAYPPEDRLATIETGGAHSGRSTRRSRPGADRTR